MTMAFGFRSKSVVIAGLLASTAMAAPAFAQDAAQQEATGVDVIVVTAQKREESLQDVPMSITAIGTEKLEQLQVQDFDDYARYLPSLSYQTLAPGFSNVYFRGVASGENANHSAQLPSVGTYLDEAPITTIQGALDLHVYDIARVEALAGPQGTLYGASSQAGTVRIITNKPDTSGFYGGANVEANMVAHGDVGYVAEAFINAPISSNAAVRIVGWYDRDAGYIDNVAQTRVFPTLGPGFDVPGTNTVNNSRYVEQDYNWVETYGGRAALKLDLDESWTVTPQVMGQVQTSHGSFAQQSGLGKLETAQYNREGSKDEWVQAALTVQGKLGMFDLTYAGAYLDRKTVTDSDYSDYAFYYDALFGYGAYYVDNLGNPLSNQYVHGIDKYTKQSHELRLSFETGPVRAVVGGFYQRQTHLIDQNYLIDGFADALAFAASGTNPLGVAYVNVNKPDNIWLTKQYRVDRDYAAFGELTFDITDKLAVTAGGRYYKFDNSLVGFFGYDADYGGTGIRQCFAGVIVAGSPCTNLDKRVKDDGFTHKLTVTYKFTPDILVYATKSRGFRPGGINRRGTLPPYTSDFIDNYEAGWKTTLLGGKLRWNGAAYWLDWSDIQFSYLGANGLTEIRNAGNGEIKGIETEVTAAPVQGLTLTLAGAYTDAKLKDNYCRVADASFACTTPVGNFVQAPAGTRLPITPKFKGNAQARYEFPVDADWDGYVQGSLVYQSEILFDLRTTERGILGPQKGYATADFAIGFTHRLWTAELYARNAFDVLGGIFKGTQCAVQTCGGIVYTYPVQPRTIGLRLGTKF